MAYKLALPQNIKIYLVFHISLLKQYILNEFEESIKAPLQPKFFKDSSFKPEFEVEKILDK